MTDPLATLLGEAAARFDAKVSSTDDGCWVWTGNRASSGHGRFHFDGRLWAAHRWVWMYHNGPIPEGMVVCHHCDNPPCVRIDHLFLGTVADNNADMRAKGRDGGWAARRAAQVACVNGHPFDNENTRVEGPRRRCRACGNARQAKYKRDHRDKAAADNRAYRARRRAAA